MRTRTFLLIFFAIALLWGVFAHLAAGTAQAGSGCERTYMVRHGDWLAAIARRFDSSVYELVRLNPTLQGRINFIYPGEILCVPGEVLPAPTREPASSPLLSFEAEYTIAASQDMTLTLQAPMTTLGIRKTLDLRAMPPVAFITTTEQISATIFGNPGPVLVAIRNDFGASPNFTLYELGSTTVLDSLRLDPSKPLTLASDCQERTLNQAFGDIPAEQPMSLTVWLQSQDGRRFPFRVSQVGNALPATYSQCSFVQNPIMQSFMAFAVVPPNPGKPDELQAIIPIFPASGGPCFGCWVQYICGALGRHGEYICTMVQ